MAIPYHGMDFTALNTLPASDLDKMVANIEALSAGTGFSAGVIPNSALAGGITNSKLSTSGSEIGAAMLSYVVPVTGFSGTPTVIGKFSIHGKFCKVYIDINGTSNSTTFTFNLPLASVSVCDIAARVTDNTINLYFGLVEINGYVASVYKDAGGSVFTNSGTKKIMKFLFEYEIA